MNNLENLKYIFSELCKGNISVINNDSTVLINTVASSILSNKTINKLDIEMASYIIRISYLLYENTDRDMLPLEDGVYDLLVALYNDNGGIPIVGSIPIKFDSNNEFGSNNSTEKLAIFPDSNRIDDMMFKIELNKSFPLDSRYILNPLADFKYNKNINRKLVNISHEYPELVGTLDKCKFVLCSKADEVGVLNDSNVKVLERDFFGKHIKDAIISPNQIITMICELKYDGISVEATVNDSIISARSRGDAVNDIAADLTPMLYGYKFPKASMAGIDTTFGIKFEAVMTYNNLYRFNQAKNYNYKNCRTAIIGLTGALDAIEFRDYITLVPLASSIKTKENMNRLEEISFLNNYYSTGEYLRYAVISGTYIEVLYQIQRFLDEAEYLRPYMPIMYDGIVVSYVDENIINKLGRVNAVNKYSMAVKFNALKRLTTFRGYSYSVGQDSGVIPMAHFDPVEFYGTIHNKTTAHSYERFKKLNLRYGDIIEAQYVNDCIVYISKPDNEHNRNNEYNPPKENTKTCPSCNSELYLSKSGKTMLCPNKECTEKNLRRIANMMDKLNIKDFAEASLRVIGKYSLTELLNLTISDISNIGPNDSKAFINKMNSIKTEPIYDYQIVGSLGFTGIAIEKWKKIFKVYTLSQLLNFNLEELNSKLREIKGLGPVSADTICTEWEFFINDLNTINNMNNVINSINNKEGLHIRFTGVRDKELMKYLNHMGHDASDGSVTKITDILLVPFDGYSSTKTSKVSDNTIIVPINDFRENMDKYLK